MAKRLDADAVGAALVRLIEHERMPLVIQERDSAPVAILPATAGARDGLLPVFLVAGEAVWREAAGQRFGLGIERDPDALLGFRVDHAGEAPMTIVMLAMLDAIEQARGSEPMLRVNNLVPVARRAIAHAKAMFPSPMRDPDLQPRMR